MVTPHPSITFTLCSPYLIPSFRTRRKSLYHYDLALSLWAPIVGYSIRLPRPSFTPEASWTRWRSFSLHARLERDITIQSISYSPQEKILPFPQGVLCFQLRFQNTFSFYGRFRWQLTITHRFGYFPCCKYSGRCTNICSWILKFTTTDLLRSKRVSVRVFKRQFCFTIFHSFW